MRLGHCIWHKNDRSQKFEGLFFSVYQSVLQGSFKAPGCKRVVEIALFFRMEGLAVYRTFFPFSRIPLQSTTVWHLQWMRSVGFQFCCYLVCKCKLLKSHWNCAYDANRSVQQECSVFLPLSNICFVEDKRCRKRSPNFELTEKKTVILFHLPCQQCDALTTVYV